MKTSIVKAFPIVLVIFHIIGWVLFVIDPKAASGLTFWNILLCGMLVFLSEKNRFKAFPALAVIFTLGFVAEIIGTKTGLLFGTYHYGATLGKQLYGVPLIIGVNWFVTVAASSAVAGKLNVSLFYRAISAGIFAVVLDLLIEPVAVKYGFWSWKNNAIPYYNYVCWFVFAAGFSWFYLKSAGGKNQTAFYLYFTWLLFFGALNLI